MKDNAIFFRAFYSHPFVLYRNVTHRHVAFILTRFVSLFVSNIIELMR